MNLVSAEQFHVVCDVRGILLKYILLYFFIESYVRFNDKKFLDWGKAKLRNICDWLESNKESHDNVAATSSSYMYFCYFI